PVTQQNNVRADGGLQRELGVTLIAAGSPGGGVGVARGGVGGPRKGPGRQAFPRPAPGNRGARATAPRPGRAGGQHTGMSGGAGGAAGDQRWPAAGGSARAVARRRGPRLRGALLMGGRVWPLLALCLSACALTGYDFDQYAPSQPQAATFEAGGAAAVAMPND